MFLVHEWIKTYKSNHDNEQFMENYFLSILPFTFSIFIHALLFSTVIQQLVIQQNYIFHNPSCTISGRGGSLPYFILFLPKNEAYESLTGLCMGYCTRVTDKACGSIILHYCVFSIYVDD